MKLSKTLCRNTTIFAVLTGMCLLNIVSSLALGDDALPQGGTKKILAYIQYSDNLSSGEYQNTLKAIRSVTTDFTVTEFSESSQLSTLLPGKDVLLVPEQEKTSDTTLKSIGAAWASTLQNFVTNGGVVIVCDCTAGYGIVSGAGLINITSKSGYASGFPVTVIATDDPVVKGIASTYNAADGSVYYDTTDGRVVVQRTGYGAVVMNKTIGLGNVVLIGHDYFNSNSDQDRIVGNAVLYLPPVHDDLLVTPGDNLNATGYEGGPFSPGSISYTLSNIGPNTIDWSLYASKNWVNAAPAAGSLTSGASTTVNINLNSYTVLLSAADYVADINFTNATSHVVQKRNVNLSVQPFQVKLTASDGYTSDNFGNAVGISGDRAIVGAYRDDDKGIDSGSAYIFEFTTDSEWIQKAKLTASDEIGGDNFGYTVAISGDYAIVGAPYDDDMGSNSGSAFIFERNSSGNWVQAIKLTPADGYSSDRFGYSVAISGSYAIVGSLYDDDKGTDSGSAYIYERTSTGWNLAAKVTASDGYTGDLFGSSVGISGSIAIIGALGDDDYGSSSGSAYVFERSSGTWTQTAKLRPADGYSGDCFGNAVAISGDYIVAGAYFDDDKLTDSGSAYIFERSGGTWTQASKLTASDGLGSDNFGYSVAISGQKAIIGAPYHDYKGTNSGEAYIFERTSSGWVLQNKITAGDGGSSDDYFGRCVGIDNSLSVIGVPYDDDKGTDSGSAYIFGKCDGLSVLAISGVEDFNSTGYQGGPFAPAAKSYRLINTSQNPIDWTAATICDWLTIDTVSGTLPAEANVVVTVSVIDSYADALAPGTYSGSFCFRNTGTNVINSRSAQLQVLRIPGKIDIEPNAAAFRDIVVGVSAKKTIKIQNTSPNYELVVNSIAFKNSFAGLFDDFNSVTIKPANWTINSGTPTIDDVGLNEPSAPYSLRMNANPGGGESVISRAINLTGFSNVEFSYWYERTGGGEHPDAGEDLVFSYWNGSSWVELDRQLGSGTDMTTYEQQKITLPASAYCEDFKLRISNTGSAGPYDDWFVDDIKLTTAEGASLVYLDGLGWVRIEKLPAMPLIIPPSGSVDVNIICSPTEFKSYETSLVISSNDADRPQLEIPVTATGVPEYIKVTPEDTIIFSGHPGGPFVPTMANYMLVNNGPSDVAWSVEEPNWANISPSGGTLAAGESVVVDVIPNATAAGKATGTYAANFVVVDNTTGMRQNRQLKLVVYTRPKIWINPTSVDLAIGQGKTLAGTLTIGNTGGDSDLVFSLEAQLSVPGGTVEIDSTTGSDNLTISKLDLKKHDFTKIKPGEKFKADELLVRFAAPQNNRHGHRTAVEKQNIISRHGSGSIERSYELVPDLCLIKLPQGKGMADALADLNADADILYAQPNYIVHAYGIPNDSSFSSLWGMHNTGQTGGLVGADIHAPEAWDKTTGSSNIIVAVIDTGIDYTHQDLAANMWINTAELNGRPGVDDDGNGYADDVYGYDFYNRDSDPMDDNYHGTHVAGTIGAIGNNGTGVAGVCWKVRLMALKFLNSSGSGSNADAIYAIQYATKMGAKVMSNSWGGISFDQALKDAIDAAGSKGIIFVAAAGNDSADTDRSPQYPSSYDSANIISVMATDCTDSRSSFSNYGLTSVDIGAPGSGIFSCSPGNSYKTLNGTSMATPHVSGACALLLSANPTLSYPQVKDALLKNVDSTLPGKCVSGGRLNVNNALGKIPASGDVVRFVPQTGIVPAGKSLTVQVIYDGNVPSGRYQGNIIVQSNDGDYPEIDIPTSIEVQAVDSCTEIFDSSDNDLNGIAIAFTPYANGRYAVSTSLATAFPVDPAGGTVMSLKDDDYVSVNVSPNTLKFFDVPYEGFFIGSNGYISFISGDIEHIETLVHHFALPRISALFDDLDPSAGGTVSWKQLSDRIVVTYENVPEYGSSNTNSFQIEMCYAGKIRLTLLKISVKDALVGLSDGMGLSPYFKESDLSAYEPTEFTADFNHDMSVNAIDYAIFSSHWMEKIGPVSSTASDSFDTVSYAGNNGSVSWAGDWNETGESDGTAAGLIQVSADKYLLLGAVQMPGTAVRSLTRSVDIGMASSAKLTYDYSVEQGVKNGYVNVQVSSDGGATWSTLGMIDNSAKTGTAQFDISAYKSANTLIGFELHAEKTHSIRVHIDNVQVAFDTPPQWVPWAEGTDMNRDCMVDFCDLAEFAGCWMGGN